MEGKIDNLTSGIQQLVGAMNKNLKQKKENKQGTEPKAPVAAQASGSGCQANFQQDYQPPPPHIVTKDNKNTNVDMLQATSTSKGINRTTGVRMLAKRKTVTRIK